jgi:hypothetical protein
MTCFHHHGSKQARDATWIEARNPGVQLVCISGQPGNGHAIKSEKKLCAGRSHAHGATPLRLSTRVVRGKKHWVVMGVHAATHKVELRHACLPVLCVYASSSSSVEALQLVKDWIVSSGGAGRAHGRRSCCWSSAARLVQEVLCDAC